MAHFWVEQSACGEWGSFPLAAGEVAGVFGSPLRVANLGSDAPDAALEVVRVELDGRGRWLLLASLSRRLMVNGRLLSGGIRVLRDRDEIVFDGARLFFSSEELARVVAFPVASGAAQEIRCARCKQPIRAGSPAVKCPFCNAWHHQDDAEERPCWTYAATCASCAQATAFEENYQWTPASL